MVQQGTASFHRSRLRRPISIRTSSSPVSASSILYPSLLWVKRASKGDVEQSFRLCGFERGDVVEGVLRCLPTICPKGFATCLINLISARKGSAEWIIGAPLDIFLWIRRAGPRELWQYHLTGHTLHCSTNVSLVKRRNGVDKIS